jgi:hypothetical protein
MAPADNPVPQQTARPQSPEHPLPSGIARIAGYLPEAVAVTPAPALSDGERSFLAFALDLAFDMMANDATGFTDDDNAAYDALRKLAGGEQDEPTNADMFSASELHDMDRADEYAMDADDDDATGGEQA